MFNQEVKNTQLKWICQVFKEIFSFEMRVNKCSFERQFTLSVVNQL